MFSSVKGAIELKLALMRLGDRAPKAAAKALYQEVEENVTAPAKEIYTPVDTGNLRSTIHTELPVIEGTRVTVTVRAGGPEAPYALAVHERLNARHAPPTQAKYIERPLTDAKKGMAARLAKRIREELT